MNRKFVATGHKAFGKLNLAGIAPISWMIDVKNGIAFSAIKVPMLPHIGTITGGRTIHGDLFYKIALHQGIQAIVDRGY